MKKGETIEQYEARARAEAELPQRIAALVARVEHLCCNVRVSTETLRRRQEPNGGGERSGQIAQ